MSTDSKDEVAKRLPAQAKTDDSKESNNSKSKKYIDKNGIEWLTNDEDTPDSEW